MIQHRPTSDLTSDPAPPSLHPPLPHSQFKVHKKSAADANPLSKQYEDITLNCRDCNAEFVFTAGEQEFYNSKGWENQPTRCRVQERQEGPLRRGSFLGQTRVLRLPARRVLGAARVSLRARGGGGGGDSRPPSRGAPICYAFQRGGATAATRAGSATTPTRPPRSVLRAVLRVPEGRVHQGDACRFSHDPNAETLVRAVLRLPEGRKIAATPATSSDPRAVKEEKEEEDEEEEEEEEEEREEIV